MLLPFVRELFTDVEKLPAFTRVASHLKEGTGRLRVSGLTPSAKALLLVLFQRAAARPLIFVVNDNRAVEDLIPVLRGFCELTAAADFRRSGLWEKGLAKRLSAFGLEPQSVDSLVGFPQSSR